MRPVCSLSLALLSVAASLSPDAAALLELDRAAAARGEVWRVVSGHWTHWSLAHLVWDVIPFAALAVMCEVLDRRRFGLCLVVSSVLISLSVISLQPEIDVYRGLSGLDSALLVLLAVSLIRAPGPAGWPIRIAALAMLAAFVGKIAFELLTGRALFVPDAAAGVVTVSLAHVVGAAVGLVLALTGSQRERASQSNISTVRATSPAFIARNASFTSSSLPRRVIISSSLRRPWR